MVLEDRDAPLLLISAGVGITPVAAILDELAVRGTSRPVTVAHADRSAASHPLFDAVSASLSSLDNAATRTWYETVDSTGSLRGARRGLMDLDDLALSPDADVFMCGPLPFMRKVRAGLVHRGVAASRIRYEVFGPDMLAAAG